MEHAAQHAIPLTEIAFVVVIAVVMGLGLMHLRQPPLVGFILAGVLLGPTGFGLVSADDNVMALAELGVLMLLFFIGTELSLKAFTSDLRAAIMVAIGQLTAALAIGIGVVWVTGDSLAEGIILGFIIGLSSTVVAMKMLDDMGELRRTSGRITVAVLIAQDIAVIPMLILVAALGGESWHPTDIGIKIAVSVTLLGLLLWWLGRRGKIRVPFAEQIEHKVEILALGSLAFCFGAAALSGFAGLSPAYGAFIAGLIVGNSTLRSRVIPVIEPIQSVLLVVFFLSIGLLIDLGFIRENLYGVAIASFLVIVAKTLLNIVLLRLAGHDRETALIGGLSMAQIGEFSFVLAAAGLSAGALGYDIYRLAIAVTAVTLLLSPAWMSIMHRLEGLASVGYSSYRAALASGYASEIDNVGEGLWWLKVRYRAGRIAWRKRQSRQEKSPEHGVEKAGGNSAGPRKPEGSRATEENDE